MLYMMRYRQPPDPTVTTVMVEAADDGQAEAIGKAWCGKMSPAAGSLMGQPKKFLSVSKAVVADASILVPEPVDERGWMEKSAIERLAEMSGKSVEQVRRDLQAQRSGRPVVEAHFGGGPAVQDEPLPDPVGVAAKIRQGFRDALKGSGA